MAGYIYLIHIREFQNQGLPIYKIGRTTQGLQRDGTCKRLLQYPKESTQLMSLWVNDNVTAERELILELANNSYLTRHTKYGNEYFGGDVKYIKQVMCEISNKFEAKLRYKKENDLKVIHLSKKKPCEEIEDCEIDTNKNECGFCKKPWNTPKARKRHEQACKYKDDDVRNLELELEIIPKYKYVRDMCRLIDKTMQQNHLRRHNTNVQLRAFGDENVEYITPDVIANIMEKTMCQLTGESEKHRFIREVFKEIFANEKHPENHNMMIRSMKGATATVWNGKEFEDRHRKEVEEGALTTIANVTNENYWEEPEKFENYKRFCERFIVGDGSYRFRYSKRDDKEQRDNSLCES